MPELPEVEVARRQWVRRAAGQVVEGFRIEDPSTLRRVLSSKPADADPEGVARLEATRGARVEGAIRRGKRLVIELSDGWALLCHLGMTGRWIRRLEGTHGRIGVALRDGSTWWFEDPRRFGAIVVARGPADWFSDLGPDALDFPWTGASLRDAFGPRGQVIKVALLDQSVLAGIGNIQAVEALWRAGIHPLNPVRSLGDAEWDALVAGIYGTLNDTLAHAGDQEVVYLSQDRDQESSFQVYGRGGQPCARCGSPLVATSVGGRTTTWCPDCQPRRDSPRPVG